MFALYGTNRAVDVPHYPMAQADDSETLPCLSGLDNALEAKTDFRLAIGWFDFFEQRELRDRRDEVINGLWRPWNASAGPSAP